MMKAATLAFHSKIGRSVELTFYRFTDRHMLILGTLGIEDNLLFSICRSFVIPSYRFDRSARSTLELLQTSTLLTFQYLELLMYRRTEGGDLEVSLLREDFACNERAKFNSGTVEAGIIEIRFGGRHFVEDMLVPGEGKPCPVPLVRNLPSVARLDVPRQDLWLTNTTLGGIAIHPQVVVPPPGERLGRNGNRVLRRAAYHKFRIMTGRTRAARRRLVECEDFLVRLHVPQAASSLDLTNGSLEVPLFADRDVVEDIINGN